MRTHASSLLVIALLAVGCGGGEFSDGGAAGAAAGAGGSSGSGGKAGAGGSAGAGATAGSSGAGGALDASAEAGPTCPGTQKVCGTQCVDTSSNPDHCGTCDKACQDNQVCQSGACTATCTGTTTNCDGACVDLNADTNHCGKCGVVCTAKANQTPVCNGGQCGSPCTDPWADCNTSEDDGCETNLDTDPAKCGSCINPCSFANAEFTCESGICVLGVCKAGFGDCDPSMDNGCESELLSDVNRCGDCNNTCVATNGVPVCNLGKCAIKECLPGYVDCDGEIANGCEIKTSSDVFNCGACGRACSGANVEAMICANGACVSSCDMGYANCSTPSSAQNDEGCETSAKDQKHCGSCSNDCATQGASPFTCLLNNTVPRCGCTSDAQCGDICSSGLCKCTSLGNANTCNPGEACKLHGEGMVCSCNAGAKCSAGQTCCAVTGCANLSTDAANCGRCGHKCAPNFSCSAGTCMCTDAESCDAGSAGACMQGVCTCATKCTAGQRCLPNGTCG